MLPPVEKRITVPLSPARAFELFTAELDSWWPKDRHSVSAMTGGVARKVTLEPGLGGKLTELCADGTEAEWATVTAWAPGEGFTIDWYVGRSPEEATQVEVRFLPAETGATVELIHSGWEVFAAKAEEMRGGYNQGWDSVLARLTKRAGMLAMA